MKIGILTHYYGSQNYGGLLQAFALVKFLRDNDIDAEQISYNMVFEPYIIEKIDNNDKLEKVTNNQSNRYFFNYLKKKVKNNIQTILYYFNYLLFLHFQRTYLKDRIKICQLFQNSIPHSEQIYNAWTINNAVQYDIYITGSDQVWNFQWFNPAFFLDFLPKNKKKIAYAASSSELNFRKQELKYLDNSLKSFDFISVREEDLKNLLAESLNLNIKHVVDPVLLINKNEWEKILPENQINDKYVFSYFLGNDNRSKEIAYQYAKAKKIKFVQIPFLSGFNEIDGMLGDIRINTAGPLDFMTLIKNAECVFTDSFHATVISIMFNKLFFVFQRNKSKSMTSRITSILNFISCNSYFCDTKEKQNLQYILKLKEINYFDISQKILNWIEMSKKELLKNVSNIIQ